MQLWLAAPVIEGGQNTGSAQDQRSQSQQEQRLAQGRYNKEDGVVSKVRCTHWSANLVNLSLT